MFTFFVIFVCVYIVLLYLFVFILVRKRRVVKTAKAGLIYHINGVVGTQSGCEGSGCEGSGCEGSGCEESIFSTSKFLSEYSLGHSGICRLTLQWSTQIKEAPLPQMQHGR